jgi:biopolymer transport protein ExbB
MPCLALSLSESFTKVWNFFTLGGWAMVPIVLAFMIMLVIIFYKMQQLSSKMVLPEELSASLADITALAQQGKLGGLKQMIDTDRDSALARISRHALLPSHTDAAEATQSTEGIAREEVSRMESGISTLEVIFTVTPMLGLIGTAVGLVTIFGNFGGKTQSAEQAGMIARGISEALNCTIAGLGVAVPAYVAQTYFARRVEKLAHRMSVLVTGLISVAFREDHAPSSAPTYAGKTAARLSIANTAASGSKTASSQPSMSAAPAETESIA